ncbi:hypothetical protein EST38_g2890 [Candolleomyces aberdarensis]|uniref:non-specific serine/threonine protein kinase n=1 Tax=Candolleomyces aberdarensis TaxID=2316362 RepID=A0A4Q2DVL0_9AGAR|nr:hypothetical protein EST38_g2890 [Candolleomyces aberdarensis]
MAPKPPCAKYQYVVTSSGPKILPVDEPACKDEESPADYNAGGYLPVKVNDTFKQGRYRVVRKLGWGHFSTVWLVKDSHTRNHSALKVVKSAGRYAETARDEIKLLSKVAAASLDHLGRAHIVSFLDSFQHQGPESSHICIVFEPLGENLLALIERNKKKGVSRALVKTVAKQILLGLQYLHDECDLVHTDIKPENILISIPDIEVHIKNELSQSPTPTSRRVGVPLPTKSRAGVTIPYNQQRARRQVQIFDSQPLSSPGRSATRSAMGNSSVTMSRAPDSGSGTNSPCSSYVAPASLAKNIKNGASLPPNTSFVGGSIPSSSIPKIPSCLSASFPVPHPIASKPVIAPTPVAPQSDGQRNSAPSTSSSSSSISSVVGSTTGGSSSIISTPPTSLSQSMTGAVAGFMNPMALMAVTDGKGTQLLPVPNKKIEGDLEAELSAALSNSWKTSPPASTSWNDKLSSSFSSSYKSKASPLKGSKPRSSNARGHNRSQSGVPANWLDPGTAAPAPAVLVSAVVGSDSQGANILSVSNVNVVDSDSAVPSGTSSISESSSATATLRPSPTGTPFVAPENGKATPPVNNVSKLLNEVISDSPNDAKSVLPIPPQVSLLTQTAPLRSNLKTPSPLADTLSQQPPISVKIADLGNATPTKKHYTEDIQTRQYRAPEAIVGRRDWDARADVWSVACVVFELLTAEYLFDPQGQGELFTKDDDHMAQIIELLGDFPLEVKMGGKYSRELFDHNGALRYIRTLKPWPLKRVMVEKYLYSEEGAGVLCDFLEPMLAVDFRDRVNARDMVDHPWLDVSDEEEPFEW